MLVKTCGLRSAEAVRAAIAAGADAIGFMLAPSRRQVTIPEAAAIRGEVGELDAVRPVFVAVTVNPTVVEIAAIAESGVFDGIQLSGDEMPEILGRIPASLSVWKAFRPGPDDPVDTVLRNIDAWLEEPNPASRIMLDAYHPGSYGGSGVVGNWALAAEVARRYPIVLAGGLTPENVGAAIMAVRPAGVDVSSGIETDGAKDPAKIAAFIHAARTAGAETSLPAGRA